LDAPIEQKEPELKTDIPAGPSGPAIISSRWSLVLFYPFVFLRHHLHSLVGNNSSSARGGNVSIKRQKRAENGNGKEEEENVTLRKKKNVEEI
jgi:hypothetical protein